MHRLLYRQGKTLADARAAIAALASDTHEAAADIALMNDFLANVERGIAR
jgi:UDP-N-acetylglucosamine acyltransferase